MHGGYIALRGAALDDRIKIVVTLSPFYALDCWMADHIPMPSRRVFAYAFGASSLAHMKCLAGGCHLRGVLGRIRVPALVVHSTGDHLSPPAEAERIVADLNGHGELLMIQGSVHCCSDIIPQIRPQMADWAVDRLSR